MTVMMRSMLEVADNSGARRLQMILPLGGATGLRASLGDVVTASVKEAAPDGQVRRSASEGRWGMSAVRTLGRIAAPIGIVVSALSIAAAAAAASTMTVTRSDGSDATSSTTAAPTCLHVVASASSTISTTFGLQVVGPDSTAHDAGATVTTDATTGAKKISYAFATNSLSSQEKPSGVAAGAWLTT